MKKLSPFIVFVCLAIGSSINVFAQNLTTVSGSNITDINGTKLASGQICFLITDQQDNPISVSIGGGGQALRRGYCSPVTAGVVTTFTVPNPANTQPSGIYYRVTVKDSSSGLEVLRYTQVSFTGTTFNFDNYAPQNLGSPAPLSGNSVTGNLSVTGNVAATGTVTGSNIPGSIPGAGVCANQFVTALNVASAPTCSNTIGGAFGITGSSNLGTTGTNGVTAGGFGTPSAIRHYCGDGTGWRCEFAKRIGSVDTVMASISDAGIINAANGYTLAGVAPSGNVLRGNGTNFVAAPLAASDLSNGTTGSGAAVLANSPSLTTPAVGSAGATFAGSTSGSITVKAASVASGTLTLPAINDQLVTRSSTDTLTNKTLGGTTPFNRLSANQGSALITSNFGGLTGWGSTATVSSVSGTDSLALVTISSSGTGQAFNAGFTLTFHDGAWPTAPLCGAMRADGFAPAGAIIPNVPTTTSASFFFNAQPVAGTSYTALVFCFGR